MINLLLNGNISPSLTLFKRFHSKFLFVEESVRCCCYVFLNVRSDNEKTIDICYFMLDEYLA